jgi:hypothetical protein
MFSTRIVQPRFQRLGMLALALTLSACGQALDEQALREFKSAHPDATVQEQFVGEGDADDAYMHFRYTTATASGPLEQMWLYQWQNDKTWRVVRKEGPKPAGSRFSD